jgi:FkbM family methyltransferase
MALDGSALGRRPMNLREVVGRAFAEGKIPTARRRQKWRVRQQFDQIVSTLGSDDIAIDCGANLGVFTRSLAAAGATVYAFEPDPYTFGRLREAVQDAPNVHPINSAVAVCDGIGMLYRASGFDADPEHFSLSSSVYPSKRGIEPGSGISVASTDLAAFIMALPRRVGLLKMDIEGAEVPVMTRLIETGVIDRVDHAFVEMHEDRIPEIGADARRLRELIAMRGLRHINLDWA